MRLLPLPVGLAALVLGAACSKDPTSPAKPQASIEAPSPSGSAMPVAAAGMLRFTVEPAGAAGYVIDAPVEKGKGKWTKFRGMIDVDPTDLTQTRGQVDMDLDDLKTLTFEDASKNTSQTEHAHNWFEIGTDVAPDVKERNRWSRFTITKIEQSTPAKLADAPDNGGRTVKVVAKGDLRLHGVTAPKIVTLTAVFTGPPDAPTSLRLKTSEPFAVSLSEHDVKPRDAIGKFISGSLEVVLKNKKIVDTAQVSIDELTLSRKAP